MTTHELKSWPEYFERLVLGHKTFELRREDDRKFAVGDLLRLREWKPEPPDYKTGHYTGRTLNRRVLSVMGSKGGILPLAGALGDGWVILSIQVAA